MKNKIIQLVLLLLLIGNAQHASARSAPIKETITTINTEQSDNHLMKKNPVLLIALLLLFTFGFQSVLGQDDLSVSAKVQLDNIAKIQKEVDNGTANYSASSPEASWLKRATTKEERDRFYERFEPNATEKKKFDEVLNALAKSLSKKGGSAVKEEIPVAMGFVIDEIKKIREQVEEFGDDDAYLVTPSEGEWLLRALSAKERERWAKSFFKSSEAGKTKAYQELDALSISAAKKLPDYTPGNQNFAFHNKAEETMMKAALKNSASLTVHKIGQFHGEWQIAKNDLDIPVSRYKQGYIWARDSKDDFAFCHLYQVNIIQDYAGGGKYGASYAKFLGDTLFGCPK